MADEQCQRVINQNTNENVALPQLQLQQNQQQQQLIPQQPLLKNLDAVQNAISPKHATTMPVAAGATLQKGVIMPKTLTTKANSKIMQTGSTDVEQAALVTMMPLQQLQLLPAPTKETTTATAGVPNAGRNVDAAATVQSAHTRQDEATPNEVSSP